MTLHAKTARKSASNTVSNTARPDPDRTGEAQAPSLSRGARREPALPHERDQRPASQATPQPPNDEVGEQAYLDVSHGLVDTDDALRHTAVERRSARPPQPTVPVKLPRQATVRRPTRP